MTSDRRRSLSAHHRFALRLTVLVALLVRLLHVLSHSPYPAAPDPASPGYLLVRAMVRALFSGDGGWTALRLFQALLGALTVWLVARLARRLHSRRAGIAAAVLATFYQHHLFMSGSFLAANLSTPLFLTALLLGLRGWESRKGFHLLPAGGAAAAALWCAGSAISLLPLMAAAILSGGRSAGRPPAHRLVWAAGGFALVTVVAVAGGALAETSLWPFPMPPVPGADGFWGAIHQAGDDHWRSFWEASQPLPLRTRNPSLMAGEIFFPWISWRLVLWTGLLGLGFLLHSGSRAARATVGTALLFVTYHAIFGGDGRHRLPLEGIFLAWSGVAAAGLIAGSRLGSLRRSRAWALGASFLMVAVVTQASASALAVRRGLADPSSLLAESRPVRLGSASGNVALFGSEALPLDRSRGRYLRLSLMARRSGGTAPFRGRIRISFLHPDGGTRSWLDTPTFGLEALPPGRWAPVEIKAHIPPSASSVRVEVVGRGRGDGALRVDHGSLRYSGGNDLALEFLFPYLRGQR